MKIGMGMLCSLVALSLGAQERVVVRPADDGRALTNPGMGWTMHYYSNAPCNYGRFLKPGDSVAWFPGCSTVYLRIPWAYLEPEEGRFNWSVLDTPAQRWIERGGQVAFRITCSESWMTFATPEWVKKAGAKGTFWRFGKGPDPKGDRWDPDFADPVFLEKLDRFLTAMAARYDGRPEVAFIDIGTYGLWGEGHTLMSSMIPQERMNEEVKRHIDLHVKHFPHTLLCISDDVSGPENQSGDYPLLDYARSKGVTLRDDSILVQPPPKSWFHADQAERYWRTLPVILEHEHYGGSKQRGAWVPELLVKAIEDYHASFLSIHWDPKVLLEENRETIDRINRRMGFRFQIRQVDYPATVTAGREGHGAASPFTVTWAWANAGVAPCYADAFPALTVKDGEGGIMAVFADEGLNLRTLPVAPPDKATAVSHTFTCVLANESTDNPYGWAAPLVPRGTFDLFVSVGKRDGTPVYELPLPDGDGKRRYRIGKIQIKDLE
ncbi:MAG: DUF4832 domain-containing protein [Kiritimatiellae bacterium]|nr:DUF4832 domain-containing protein [Kiritimatiellia bacterium]